MICYNHAATLRSISISYSCNNQEFPFPECSEATVPRFHTIKMTLFEQIFTIISPTEV